MTNDNPQSSNEDAADSPNEFDHVQLKNALKGFKKRLKLARLDDESRLGHGPMSSGGRSGIVAIAPPTRYPPAIWDELVRLGKLRRAEQGLYQLATEL